MRAASLSLRHAAGGRGLLGHEIVIAAAVGLCSWVAGTFLADEDQFHGAGPFAAVAFDVDRDAPTAHFIHAQPGEGVALQRPKGGSCPSPLLGSGERAADCARIIEVVGIPFLTIEPIAMVG